MQPGVRALFQPVSYTHLDVYKRQPCLFVVTRKSWVLVDDASLLYRTIDQALAQTSGPATGPGLKPKRTINN